MHAIDVYPNAPTIPCRRPTAVHVDADGQVASRVPYLLRILAVALALVLAPSTLHALSCNPESQAIAIMLCNEGACTDGLLEMHVLRRDSELCETRILHRDLTRRERVNFEQAIRAYEAETPNGIYRITTYASCLWNGWNGPTCAMNKAGVTILTGATDSFTLTLYEAGLLLRAVAKKILNVGKLIGIVLIAVLLVLWPRLLVAYRPTLQRFLAYMSVAALPGQGLVLYLLETVRTFPYPWLITGKVRVLIFICQILVVLAVVWQFAGRIWRKRERQER